MTKDKTRKEKVLKYTVLFEAAPEGGYTVSVPSLPGCISEGDTFEESIENIKEAINLWLEDAKEEDLETIYSPSEIFTAPVHVKISRK